MAIGILIEAEHFKLHAVGACTSRKTLFTEPVYKLKIVLKAL
jgi:hypothetical protein